MPAGFQDQNQNNQDCSMAAIAGNTRPMGGPSYADSIHDGRWEFIQPPHEPQQYQPQPSSNYQSASTRRTDPSTIDPTSNPSAFSRHSLHEAAMEPARYHNTTQHMNEDEHYMPTYTADGERENIEDGMTTEEQEFHDKWIHRDKLAEIESKELEEIGLRLGLPLRLAGAGSVRDPRDVLSDSEEEPGDIRGGKRLRVDTNSPHSNSENELPMSSYGQQGHTRNLSGGHAMKSRIPVSKSSPLARTAPFNSSPSGQASWRNSLNSPSSPLNPNQETNLSALPPPRSSTTSPSIRTRKTSQPLGTPRQPSSTLRQTSTTHRRTPSNPITNPKRRSWTNPSSTPSRPETPSQRKPSGDAPWLATMFKPDPLLPPEQQMLPTHAKRLAMERGERVLTNEEILEAEIEEARRAEGGFVPGSNNPAKVEGLDAVQEKEKEKEKEKENRMSSRPSIRKLFSRNSVNSAKDLQRQSQTQLPTQQTISEYSQPYQSQAQPPQQHHLQNQTQPRQEMGPNQPGSMQFVQNLQREHLTPRQSFHSQAQSQRARNQEEEQWPLPSPRQQQTQQQTPRMNGEAFEKDLEAGHGGSVNGGQGLGIGGGGMMSEKPIVTRVPEKMERNREEKEKMRKEKKEGGCGCCVVM